MRVRLARVGAALSMIVVTILTGGPANGRR
jgi:hypothetical protein